DIVVEDAASLLEVYALRKHVRRDQDVHRLKLQRRLLHGVVARAEGVKDAHSTVALDTRVDPCDFRAEYLFELALQVFRRSAALCEQENLSVLRPLLANVFR